MDGQTARGTGGASQAQPHTPVITLCQHLKGAQPDGIPSVPFYISEVETEIL